MWGYYLKCNVLTCYENCVALCYGCLPLPVEQDGSANKGHRGEYGKDEDGLDEGEPDEEGESSDEAADQKDHVDKQPRNKKPPG